MANILIIGAAGQLGTDLGAELERRGRSGDVAAVDIDEVDICDHDGTRIFVHHRSPSLVINLAAYHHVDTCESTAASAFATNAVAVHNLARVCAEVDAVLVHFSTDFVFDGAKDRTEPFTEEDVPNPQSVYAASKLAGEHLVRQACDKHFVIRTCGLYGVAAAQGRSTNFVETMLRLAGSGNPLRVVDDQRLTPTATMDLASKVLDLITTGAYGLYHLTNGGSCTWYEFATEIFRIVGLQPDLKSTTSEEYDAPARRPHYSVLDHVALRRAGLESMRPWKDALADYIKVRQESAA
ncbi:MAG: dTDP-4-dehydrorhamnose reductase [Myxococcota bacterium]